MLRTVVEETGRESDRKLSDSDD